MVFFSKLFPEVSTHSFGPLYFYKRKLALAHRLPMALVVKNLPANAEDIREVGLIPGLGGSPGEGNGNPLQYSGLENPMDGGAWQAISVGLQRVKQD